MALIKALARKISDNKAKILELEKERERNQRTLENLRRQIIKARQLKQLHKGNHRNNHKSR